MTIKGSCSCGSVSYEIAGKLNSAGSCHCSICRKASGSQSSAYAMFNPDEFSWSSDEGGLTYYQSSEDMGSYFCSKCGSTLGGSYKGDICWVTLGCVEGNPEIKVEKHIFMGSKASWETNPSDVLQYEEFADENA